MMMTTNVSNIMKVVMVILLKLMSQQMKLFQENHTQKMMLKLNSQLQSTITHQWHFFSMLVIPDSPNHDYIVGPSHSENPIDPINVLDDYNEKEDIQLLGVKSIKEGFH